MMSDSSARSSRDRGGPLEETCARVTHASQVFFRKDPTMPHQMPSKETQQCIKDCAECASMCAQTAHHCLHLGGEHASPEHQGLLQDCKQICATALGFMSRASHHAGAICRECAEICNAC